MTLLLAQPDTITDFWVPLAKAINRFLWRWSPWHLRDTLSRYGYTRSPAPALLTIHGSVDRWFLDRIPASELPIYKRYVERDMARRLAEELVKSDAIRRREEVLPHDLSHVVTLEVAVLKPWRPV